MLLHIGGDVCVRLREVVMIIDRSSAASSPQTRELLELAKSERRLGTVNDETKSYVVTNKIIYPSPISSTTLAKRASNREVF